MSSDIISAAGHGMRTVVDQVRQETQESLISFSKHLLKTLSEQRQSFKLVI